MNDASSKLETLRAKFKASGISIKQWADRHGFSSGNVFSVLHGRNKATRGESFRIAVALGIKDRPPIEDAPQFIKKMLELDGPITSKALASELQEFALEQSSEFCHQRLANERRRVGLSPSELADIGGVSRATQFNYESGKSSPTLEYLGKIQDVIDVRFVLFDGAGRMK